MAASRLSRLLRLRRQPIVHHLRLHLNELDSGVSWAGSSAEFFQFVRIVGMGRNVVDHEHGLRAVDLGIRGFAENLRVRGINLAVEHAVFVEFLRLVAQHDNDFAFHVQARVVVVVVFGSRDAVPHEHGAAYRGTGGGKVERCKILPECERFLLRALCVADAIVRPQPRAGGHFEILIVAVAGERLQVQGAEAIADERGRFFQLWRSGGAPAHALRGQKLDVAHVLGGTQLGGKQAADEREQNCNSHVTYSEPKEFVFRSTSRRRLWPSSDSPVPG